MQPLSSTFNYFNQINYYPTLNEDSDYPSWARCISWHQPSCFSKYPVFGFIFFSRLYLMLIVINLIKAWILCFSSHSQVERRGKREEALPKLVPRSWTIGGLTLPWVWPHVKRSAWLSHMFGPSAGSEYISPLPCVYNWWDTTAHIP